MYTLEEIEEWRGRFREMGYEPYMWSGMHLLEDNPPSLRYALLARKMTDLNALKKELGVKGGRSKPEVVDLIVPQLDYERSREVLEHFEQIKQENRLKLLEHSKAILDSNVNRLKMCLEADEFVPAVEVSGDDECPICRQYNGRLIHIQGKERVEIPPYHPGCRCYIVPVVKYDMPQKIKSPAVSGTGSLLKRITSTLFKK